MQSWHCGSGPCSPRFPASFPGLQLPSKRAVWSPALCWSSPIDPLQEPVQIPVPTHQIRKGEPEYLEKGNTTCAMFGAHPQGVSCFKGTFWYKKNKKTKRNESPKLSQPFPWRIRIRSGMGLRTLQPRNQLDFVVTHELMVSLAWHSARPNCHNHYLSWYH